MVIDLSFINSNPRLFYIIGIIVLSILALFFLSFIFKIFIHWFWLPARQAKYLNGIKFILLAIDIPKNNEQSPKAVEQVFATLAGTLSGPNLYEKYWLGNHQLSFSLELVSLEGYIQYIIHTPERYRDVVEAAFFAQYPDAEIIEVPDYTANFPDDFPNETYNLWGTDLKLGNKNPYPIRTYPRFEHTLSQEIKDPISSLLEVMSHLRRGEFACLQWVITPINDSSWKLECEKEVKKIIGEKQPEKKDLGYYLTSPFLTFMKFMGDTLVVNAEGSADVQAKREDAPNKILYLTSGQKDVLQAIEEKMSKIGFLTKGRFIYLSRREIFDKNRGVAPIMGGLNQFNTLNMNFFTKVKTTTTKADYWRVEQRMAKKQTKIINAYKSRIGDSRFGNYPFILNIEELATVYHFPNMTVKAPLVKKVESKRSEPPAALPVDFNLENDDSISVVIPEEKTRQIKNDLYNREEQVEENNLNDFTVVVEEIEKNKDKANQGLNNDDLASEKISKGQPPTNLPF